jgi:DNA polymerase/3'-5' exonuclease PolX
MDGNALFKAKSYQAAAEHYSKALAHVETIENNAKMPTSDIGDDIVRVCLTYAHPYTRSSFWDVA